MEKAHLKAAVAFAHSSRIIAVCPETDPSEQLPK